MVAIQLKNELSEMDKKAFKEAKELVYRLEQNHPGDPNAIRAGISRANPQFSSGRDIPTRDEIYKMRVVEMARAYEHVSDGKMGIDGGAHKTKLSALSSVLDGNHAQGHGYSEANRSAIAAGKAELLSTTVAESLSKRNILVGGVFVLAAGVAAAAEPNSTSESVGRAMVDSSPALAAARKGDACKAFAEVVGGGTGAIAAGLTLTAVNGLAVGGTVASGGAAAPVTIPAMIASTGIAVVAGATTASAVTPVAESACNFLKNTFSP